MISGSFLWCSLIEPKEMDITETWFSLNIRNHLFTTEVTEQWQKLPREVVSLLEVFKS